MTNASEPLSLSVAELTVRYGAIVAVNQISLEVGAGEVVALIGANGAGKTSLMRAISGLATAVGSVKVSTAGESTELVGLAPHCIPGLGLAHVPEGRGMFLNLSVLDNLKAGAILRKDSRGIRDDLERRLAQFPRLRERLHRPSLTLSGGEQQMLAIARALMSRPRLLLLDEPSLGLAPKLVAEVFATIQQLSQEGMSVLLVEQNARMALRVSSRAYVLEGGRVALSGPSKQLASDDQVRSAYLGGA